MSNIKFVHSGGNSVSLTTPDSNPAANRTFKLPGADGSAGQFLKTDGNGALSFASPSANTGARQVLEQFGSFADGSTHVLSQGSITLQNVQATQLATTTWADANGSVINYQPPAGTVQVLFEYNFFYRNVDATGILFIASSVDDTANVNSLLQLNSPGEHHHVSYKFAIHIGPTYTDGAAAGQYTSWGNSTKKLSVKIREYSSTYECSLFDMPNMPGGAWYGSGFSATGTSGTNSKQRPYVGITALGSPS